MSKIDQELSYGMNIITAQLQIIMHFYEYQGCNIYQLTEQHIQRFVRLVNNLCVIMIYLKFCATHFNTNNELMDNPDFIQVNDMALLIFWVDFVLKRIILQLKNHN